MSSNFCSRKVDWSKFDLVYAGAQKNVGPAGVTIVVMKTELLKEKPRKDVASVFDYGLFAKSANGFFNTPCCWSVYMAGLNIAHML
jgi:phosphoserine aminotransferase